jgi:tRNA nucleotidyltransferase (CCA-adding enzyme)
VNTGATERLSVTRSANETPLKGGNWKTIVTYTTKLDGKMKFYLVGGLVRDKLLGLKPKDNDYVVEAKSYEEMRSAIVEKGGEIFLESPAHFTIRALVPDMGVADFVLPRVDGFYSDGRRPDSVMVGTLMDDLARRDFTVNAIAYDEQTDQYIDPHSGRTDLDAKLLRCVDDPFDRFEEDALRMLRAIRFAITKGFEIHESVEKALDNAYLANRLMENVSGERKREELHRCFACNTLLTLDLLSHYDRVRDACFNGGSKLWLMPTMRDA